MENLGLFNTDVFGMLKEILQMLENFRAGKVILYKDKRDESGKAFGTLPSLFVRLVLLI